MFENKTIVVKIKNSESLVFESIGHFIGRKSHITLGEKAISLQGKYKGNRMEITFYNTFLWGFHPGDYLFPCVFPRGETPYAPVYMPPSHGNPG